MKMKEFCEEERPREKMLLKGCNAMSNAELLAILIGSGTKNGNVLDVANRLLSKSEGKLAGIAQMNSVEMQSIDGIGLNKYSSIIAALELGKRYCLEDPEVEKVPVTNAEKVFKTMISSLKGLDHEELWVIYLNRANYIIHKEMLSLGGLHSTIIDTKRVVKKALDKHASGMIMIHNHPSGNPRPGRCDIEQTELLKKAADTFDISLIDHIIICDDCFFSFAEDKVTSLQA